MKSRANERCLGRVAAMRLNENTRPLHAHASLDANASRKVEISRTFVYADRNADDAHCVGGEGIREGCSCARERRGAREKGRPRIGSQETGKSTHARKGDGTTHTRRVPLRGLFPEPVLARDDSRRRRAGQAWPRFHSHFAVHRVSWRCSPAITRG